MKRFALPLALLAMAAPAGAQSGAAAVGSERAELARWLKEAPTSPLRALAQVPIGPGITIGPAASDVPLEGVPATRIEEKSGRLTATAAGTARPLARDRAQSLGKYRIVPAGLAGRGTVTVYGPDAKAHAAPDYFGYAAASRLVVTLDPVRAPKAERVLAPDGSEVEATEAGTVAVALGGKTTVLRVLRIPAPGGEESDLEIYFQDATNGKGTYPAGRFVSLIPDSNGRYVLDLNRARNPFCAYNTVFACPAPWRGNRIPAPVEAGERYSGTS